MRDQIINAIKNRETTDDQFAHLIANATNVREQDQEGRTFLHHVLQQDHERISFIDILLSYEFDENTKDNNGNTPAHYAVSHNKANSLARLITNCANLNMQNNDGDTPLHTYAKLGPNAGVAFLNRFQQEFSVAFTITNKQGETPLHSAIIADNQHFFMHFVNVFRNRYYNTCDIRNAAFQTGPKGDNLVHTVIRQLSKDDQDTENRTYSRLIKLAEAVPEMFFMRNNDGTFSGDLPHELAAKMKNVSGRILKLAKDPYAVHFASASNVQMLGAMQETINAMADQMKALTNVVRDLKQEVAELKLQDKAEEQRAASPGLFK